MPVEDVIRLEEQVKTLFNEVGEIKRDLKDIKQQLASRLPLWATMLISILVGSIGWLAGK